MHQERENLDILFRRRTPESVLKELREIYFSTAFNCDSNNVPYELNSFEQYDRYGFQNLQGYSLDEIRVRYDYLNMNCRSMPYSVFGLLSEYTNKILLLLNNEPVCKIEEVLNWNSISSRIGQDILVTAWLAGRDFERSSAENSKYYKFGWPYCIRTNDKRLNMILERGTAENHFHLGGSTQIFSLSWAMLMNHPNQVRKLVKAGGRLKRNLVTGAVDVDSNMEERWISRLLYASLIRGLLFMRCIGGILEDDLQEEFWNQVSILDVSSCKLNDMIERMRFLYGVKVTYPEGDKCLDYVMCDGLYCVDMHDNNRLLAGERGLLYHCFKLVYKDELTLFEKTLFYVYLLVKNNFRGELVQINKRNGFRNFSEYQKRKGQFFGRMMEYNIEAQRLAICSTISENHIKILEARIMPEKTRRGLEKRIANLDNNIRIVSSEDLGKVCYIIHFPKTPFTTRELDLKSFVLHPRNYMTRKITQKQAKAIYLFRKESIKFGHRLCGIDACSNEIGCRPETFATEFRFLRNCDYATEDNRNLLGSQDRSDLGITFHVGEDFLDICDGLRAVDEAVEFLELRNGDRIGHALVLGMDAQDYYSVRRNNVFMSKQDYLDNCVWLLFRSQEWNIPLESSYREYIKGKANALLYELYGNNLQHGMMPNLELYYYSWYLRADHPDLYRSGLYTELDERLCVNEYDRFLVGRRQYDSFRRDRDISKYYYLYQFDINVKQTGLQIIPIKISCRFIQLMAEFQKYMQRRIAHLGISIECNPSSNYLIGYFNMYEQHPILKFNSHRLNGTSEEAQISVSINTDDLGVFDTSLSFEYALLFSAIRKKRHLSGCYNDEAIYDYLDAIRKYGLEMHFGYSEI